MLAEKTSAYSLKFILANLSQLEEFAAGSTSPLLRIVAKEGIGYALEAKALAEESPDAREAGLREAMAAFTGAQPEEDGPRHDVALYHEARILATLDERDKAIELFRKILEIEPPSMLGDKANQRLALLKATKE